MPSWFGLLNRVEWRAGSRQRPSATNTRGADAAPLAAQRNITNRATLVRHSRPAGDASGGPRGPSVPVSEDEALVILVGIDAEAALLDDADLDGVPRARTRSCSSFSSLFQRFGRQGGQAQQERPAVGVQAEVLQEPRPAAGEVGLAVADVGDGAAAEVEALARWRRRRP